MGRKARLKRQRRAKPPELREFEREVEHLGVTVVETPLDQTKISDAIFQVALPLLEGLGPNPPREAYEKAIDLVVQLWNVDSFPDERSPALLAAVRDRLGKSEPVPGVAAKVIDRVLARRRELFPDDRRIVTATRLHPQPGGGYALSAAFELHGPTPPSVRP